MQMGTAKITAANERLLLEIQRERDTLASANQNVARMSLEVEQAHQLKDKVSPTARSDWPTKIYIMTKAKIRSWVGSNHQPFG